MTRKRMPNEKRKGVKKGYEDRFRGTPEEREARVQYHKNGNVVKSTINRLLSFFLSDEMYGQVAKLADMVGLSNSQQLKLIMEVFLRSGDHTPEPKPASKTKRINVYLDPDEERRLIRLAKQMGCSQTRLVERAIKEFFVLKSVKKESRNGKKAESIVQ